ncbi:shikimate kinase, partial [Planomicrobium okeanokoites]|uniref:shikimate kinase n=1 Tax=Planomicrobium okeanokoites TaxID=244 RepID=UPI003569ABC7
MTIDLLEPLYGFTPEMWRLAKMFRREIFQSFSKNDQYGMIFTKIWYFDQQEDWDEIEYICNIFSSQGVEIYFVELEADVEVRILRNKTDHRLEHKPTKRNIEQSELHLLDTFESRRMNSKEAEIKTKNYIRINNTNLNSAEVALRIKREFNL